MKKQVAIAVLLTLTLANPVFASQNGNNGNNGNSDNRGKSEEHKNSDKSEVRGLAVEADDDNITPTVSLTVTPSVACDRDAEWKNHGKYVSCVAHQHRGGVSDAARSDVGKHNKGHQKPSVTPSVSPSVSPTATPTATPTVTGEPTPSVSVTPPITSAQEIATLTNPFETLAKLFQALNTTITAFINNLV